MSEQNNAGAGPPGTNEHTYQRILKRLKDSLEQAEQKTAELIRHEIDQAIELEEAAEEMTLEELDLIRAYLKRDLSSLSHFVEATGKGVAEWLKFDLHLLEDKLASLLLSVADQTVLEQFELEQVLEQEGDDKYRAGETVIAGTFSCKGCGDIYVITRPETLQPCIECGGEAYRRVSKS